MFNLEKAISTWRHLFARRRGFLKEDLDELERHLRDDVRHAVEQGVPEEEAFRRALAEIGDYEEAEDEYRKVYWGKLQRRRTLGHEIAVRISMFKNYFKTTLRSLARKKGYSFINIAGLTVGLACCLVIFQYVAFEYSFDRFHENEADIYRVLLSTPLESEPHEFLGAWSGFAVAPAMKDDVPEIVHATRVHPEYSAATVANPSRPDLVFEEEDALYVDPSFLEIFSFPLKSGSGSLRPGTMLISERSAEKYFGDANPIGQVLEVSGAIQRSYEITGVLKNVPANSHLEFEFLMPMEDLVREGYANEPEQGYSWNNFATYVQLRSGADADAAAQRMSQSYATRRAEMLRQQGRKAQIAIQPLREIHLNAEISGPAAVTGNYRTVYFFMVIGLVTLLIALVNYVNLATARALDRAREVGVRKVVGAQRKQLIVQFLCESALTNLFAAVLAVLLAMLLTPLVNNIAETRLTFDLWLNPVFWIAFFVTFTACTVLAGLYPAFVLSSFRPVSVLKGKTGSFARELWMRRGLVVLQFAASVVLIGGTAVVYDQLTYMRRMDLGLEIEQVLAVDGPRVFPEGTNPATGMATFVQELRRIPAVRQVATSTSIPGRGFNWNGASVRKAEDDPSSTIRGVATYIDTSFASLYGLELLAGRDFSEMAAPDTAGGLFPVIANETAVRTLGFESPADAVDHSLDFGGFPSRIVGVYKDFNWTSAHQERQNIFFGRFDSGRQVSLRLATDDLANAIPAIEATYERLFPGNVFRYNFVDEIFNEQYQNEERFATLFTLFAGLAIAIACLGLFGLASFTAQQRTHEIGVRKVLGASVPGLVSLLARDFLKLVVVAVVIASPVVYLLMKKWLEGFAYHVEISPALFLFVGLISVFIALVTVAYQSIRAATADPTRSLRVA